jgi:Flp pilus assembly pilin Flp
MFHPTFRALRRCTFVRDEKGTASIEAVIMVPLIFTVLMTIFTLSDLFRQHSMHQKAANTIGDMISRETLPIDADYLNGAHALFDTLTRDPQDSKFRVSVVRYDNNDKRFKLDWSKTMGDIAPLTNSGVLNWDDRLPVLLHNERIIVVETSAAYSGPMDIGLGNRQIENFVFTRPRYAPQVLWSNSAGGGLSGTNFSS